MLSFKDIRELQKSAKARRMQGLFIAEGIKMFREAPKESIERVLVSESFLRENEALLAGAEFESVPDERFISLCDTKTPQGILTVLRRRTWTPDDILAKKNPLVMILENLQDPGNAGTILRSAEAAGVDGIFMTRGSVDMTNPKTIRSTMGSVYRMPCVMVEEDEAEEAGRSGADRHEPDPHGPDQHGPDQNGESGGSIRMPELLELLMERGIRTYAAYLDAPASYLTGDYREGTAFMIGNESTGLTQYLANLSDRLVSIPMKGEVESLNAAMAAGVLMFEAARQRSAK